METSPETGVKESSNPRPTDDREKPLTRDGLASLRSLIVNPSTPDSLISSILESLTRNLQSCSDHLLLHHTIKLLTELCVHRIHLSDLILNAVRSFALSTESTTLVVESLDSAASISKHENPCDDSVFVSLCFSASRSTRLWLLRNAERFKIRPYLLFTVFLGFTKDPYPCIRKAALDGLISLSKSAAIEERSLIEGCFCRAVELLSDYEASVRASAVRTVRNSEPVLN